MSAVGREWDYDSSALDKLMESTKDLGGRLEAFNFLDNKSKSSMDERVRAVGAPVSGGVNGSAQGMEGMSNTFGFERSADNLNYGVDNREQCEMFSKLMNNNALLQEECKGLKDELKVWKEEVLVSLKKTLVDSLSNFGNFFMNAIDCHDKHVTGLLNRSINSNSAIYKVVTGVLEQSMSGIGVEIREGLLKDIEACVDRSMKKVQGEMIKINKMEWEEFREEIVENFEKINYDKKCHDLLLSSGEKHVGEGAGVHMNGEQLSNAGGGVSGGQAESGTHLASAKCAGLSGRGAVLGVRCVGAQEGYVRSNREFNRPQSNCARRQLNNNYFWRDQRSFHGKQRVGYKREYWRERKFIRCYVCNRAGHIAYYCHKRHLGSWPQRAESRVIPDAGAGTEEQISGGSKEEFFNLGMGDKFVQNELLCRNYEMLKHGAVECNDLEGGGNIFDMG